MEEEEVESQSSRPSAAASASSTVLTRISSDAIDVGALLAWCTHPSAGGIGLFVGTTRDTFQGKTVTRLEYEAFEPMAAKALSRIAWALQKRYGLTRVALVHRTGRVDVTEASVAVVCSSVHRREALEAAAAGIAAIKARLPVWKLEWYEGEDRAWKQNCECAGAAPATMAARLRRDGEDVDVDAWLGPVSDSTGHHTHA